PSSILGSPPNISQKAPCKCDLLLLLSDEVLSCLGYRSVPLKNSYSEELELASLLVHIEIVNAKEEDEENLYSSIQRLRERTIELTSQVSGCDRGSSSDPRHQQRLEELRAAQEQLTELTEARSHRYI
uniref:Uncharacterized protein n=1 Tax=Callorhinchus milii TaxID=7868 RepID=A0A4W3HB65_CALMI